MLLVSPLPPPAGGIARWTLLVTCYLQGRRDVSVRVVDTALRLRSPQSDSRLLRIVAGSTAAAWTIARCVVVTIWSRPEVVHVNVSGQMGLFRDLVVVRWCRALRLPVVVHIRFGRVPDIARSKNWEWRVIRRVLANASVAIAIDELTEATLSNELPATPRLLIPNCVQVAARAQMHQARLQVVLFVGWLIPSKGVEELLEAWQSVGAEGVLLKLMGGYERSYASHLETRGLLGPGIELVGEVTHEEVLEAMGTCAMFVLPSHTEGFPNVVLEAMSMGAPVIATSVGAIPEMLARGAGVLVPPNDVTALVSAMRETLSDPHKLQMGERARERAEEKYSIEAVVSQYVDVWKDLAKQ